MRTGLLLPSEITVGGEWRSVDGSLDYGRGSCAAFCVDGEIVVLGGSSPSVEVLNLRAETSSAPVTCQWDTRKEMKSKRTSCAAAVLTETSIIVAGGSFTNTAEMYDTLSDAWTDLPSMNARRLGCAAAVLGDDVYVFGGAAEEGPSAEVYNVKRRKWTPLSPMPTQRHYCTVVPLNDNCIMVLGGSDPSNGSQLKSVEAYNTVTKLWTQMPSMNTGRMGCAAVKVGRLVVVIGGRGIATGEVFDPKINKWMDMRYSMREARSQLSAVVLDGTKIIAVGGTSNSGKELKSVEEFPLDFLRGYCQEELLLPSPNTLLVAAAKAYCRPDALHQEREEDEVEVSIKLIEQSKEGVIAALQWNLIKEMEDIESDRRQIEVRMRRTQLRISELVNRCPFGFVRGWLTEEVAITRSFRHKEDLFVGTNEGTEWAHDLYNWVDEADVAAKETKEDVSEREGKIKSLNDDLRQIEECVRRMQHNVLAAIEDMEKSILKEEMYLGRAQQGIRDAQRNYQERLHALEIEASAWVAKLGAGGRTLRKTRRRPCSATMQILNTQCDVSCFEELHCADDKF